MQGIVSFLLANSNMEDSLNGLGALKGAPCVLSSIEEITNDEGNVIGNRLTFEWTGISGAVETKSFNVMNGKDGSGSADIENITQDEIDKICVI